MAKQSLRTIIIEVTVLIAIVAGVVWYLQSRANTDTGQNNSSDTTEVTEGNVNTASDVTTGTQTQTITPVENHDEDGDGISDEQEAELGTNTRSADSDNDGLTDYDEVNLYGSNPLVADTDGDGNVDGIEVENGYSPTDSTTLLDFESEKQKFNE